MKGFLFVIATVAVALGLIVGVASILTMAEHGPVIILHGEPITDAWLAAVASGFALCFGVSLFSALWLHFDRYSSRKEARERLEKLGAKVDVVNVFLSHDAVNAVLTILAKEVRDQLDHEEEARKGWLPPEGAPRADKHRLVLEKLTHRRSVSTTALRHFERACEMAKQHGFTFEAETWEEFVALAERVSAGEKAGQEYLKPGDSEVRIEPAR